MKCRAGACPLPNGGGMEDRAGSPQGAALLRCALCPPGELLWLRHSPSVLCGSSVFGSSFVGSGLLGEEQSLIDIADGNDAQQFSILRNRNMTQVFKAHIRGCLEHGIIR